MNGKKLFIVIAGLVAIFTMAACTALPAQAADPTTPPVRQLTVSGTGTVNVVPDIAYVTVGVHSQADTVEAALKDNNAQAQAIQKALTDQGVDPKDIQTSTFNVYPQTQQPNPPNSANEPAKTTYVVDNSVSVKVRDLQKLGAILDAVVASGANNINSIQFDVSDKTEALAQARKMAIQDAEAQAKQIAGDAGVSLGAIQTLNVSTGGLVMPMYGKGAGYAVADSTVPVSSGQLQITANANITYIIQ